MSEVNEGVGIILARMETHPEEFFSVGDQNNKWRWIFSESLREVMTEPEKAAIHSGMTKVRRLEITHKAIATVMPQDEEEDNGIGIYSQAHPQKVQPKKMIVNASQMELARKLLEGQK